jgi:hypothetical protein
MPLPTETELRVQLSPVPTQTTFLSVGSSAIAPTVSTGALSKTGLKVVPPSSERHTPPDALPTNSVTLPSSSTRPASAAIRPLMAAEPMFRAPSPEKIAASTVGVAGGAAAVAAAPRRLAIAIAPRRVERFMAAPSRRRRVWRESPGS